MPRQAVVPLLALLFLAFGAPVAESKPRVKIKAPRADWDRDGLNNRYERRSGTRPRRADSDRDGVLDGREDRDRDSVANATEQLAKTEPRRKDSDRDGVRDGSEDPDADRLVNRFESLLAWHPRKADSDGDGTDDGDENPGVVVAVNGSEVTVELLVGGTLNALVSDFTDILCSPDRLVPPVDGDAPSPEDEWSEDEATWEDDGTWEDDSWQDDGSGEDVDEDLGQDDEGLEKRAAVLGECSVDVGDIVYELEVEEFEGVVEFVTLDLLGP